MKNKLIFLICIFLLILSVASCGGDGDVPDTSADSTDGQAESGTATESETEADTGDIVDVPEYEVYTENNAVYHIYSDHAELVSVTAGTQFIVPERCGGKPLTVVSEDALNGIEDKANFRLFGESDSIARDYAIEHGCIFIEWYDGSLPDHYYPYNGDESVWVETEDEYDYFYAEDNHERISSLVAQYLDNGEGYDELMELILYQVACAAEFWIEFADVLPEYYTRKAQSAAVDDYDKYHIYHKEDDGYNSYPMVRYGELDTYDKIVSHIGLLYSTHILTQEYETNLVNVEGYAFQIQTGIGSCCDYSEAEYTMLVYESAIYLISSHREVNHGEDMGYTTVCREILLKNGKWVFDDLFYHGFERQDYLAYISEK